MSINRKDYIDRISTLPNESLEDIVFSHKVFKGHMEDIDEIVRLCYNYKVAVLPTNEDKYNKLMEYNNVENKGAYCYGIALELIPNDYYCVVIGLSNYNIIYY